MYGVPMAWLTAEQALEKLGTKPQTLYANVSRGRIRARPDTADSRRSLYHAEDVARLAERHAGRRKAETVAAEAIDWGNPVMPSSISTIIGGSLYYRGKNATDLAAEETLEQTAAWLWETASVAVRPSPRDRQPPSITQAFVALAARVTGDLPSLGRAPGALKAEACSILSTVADALAPGTDGTPLHQRLAACWGRADAADPIRRALVLMADHELNASTFAARVTVSSGASLSAAVLSGLAALTGPLHGGAWRGVTSLAAGARRIGAAEAIRRALAEASPLAAFGHPLYPGGDVRAQALLSHVEMPQHYAELAAAGEEMVGEKVNVDFALSAMAAAFDLPDDAPLVIFALARSVGWLAHAMEQAGSGHLIRPRARYIGPPATV
jgi:citrate synthase